jgi:nucleoside-diphosphate-sugar epimerase
MILVTGANGFIGQSLVLALLARGEQVVGVDRNPAMYPDEVTGDAYREALLDIKDSEQLLALVTETRPDVIIALAEGAEGPMTGLVAHAAQAATRLLDIAAAAGVKRVCLTSSLAVYLGLEGPFQEDMALPMASPLHICGMKKAEELVGQWYADHSEIEIVAMRLANIYGPRYHSMMNLPSRYLFAQIGREFPPRPSLDKQFYASLADFCHVSDCAQGIALIATAPTLRHRIYNVASGQGVTDAQIEQAAVRAASGTGGEPGEGIANYLDITRIGDELGYAPVHNIDSGMADYRAWLADHDR